MAGGYAFCQFIVKNNNAKKSLEVNHIKKNQLELIDQPRLILLQFTNILV